MEINVRAEKYLNADAPEITEEMLDWLFLTMWHTRFDLYTNKVDTIDIMANTAFDGSRAIHFYITINGEHTFHKEWYTNTPTSLQNPTLGYYHDGVHTDELNWLGEKRERWEWMYEFVLRGVDMGPEGVECKKRMEAQRLEAEKRETVQKEIEFRKNQYNQYIRLKEKYLNNDEFLKQVALDYEMALMDVKFMFKNHPDTFFEEIEEYVSNRSKVE